MQKLIDHKGKIEFGHTLIDEVNYLDFDLRNPMDKALSQWQKKLKFNQFQFISLISSDFIIGMAIVDLKYASNCFVYLYHIKTEHFEEFDFIQPLAINTKMSLHPNQGESSFICGKNQLFIQAKDHKRHIKLTLSKGIQLQASIEEPKQQYALSLCSKAGYNGWVYTQKTAALLLDGELNWKQNHYPLKQYNTLANVDWSAGFMRRETNWHWASLSCYLDDGRRLGFNFASGVNETGFSENALWLDGDIHHIDMIDFKFDRYNESANWQLSSNDGSIELTFNMQGKRAQKMNLILIASNFRQFFGRFNGSIQLKHETIQLTNSWGLVEDHYAKW